MVPRPACLAFVAIVACTFGTTGGAGGNSASIGGAESGTESGSAATLSGGTGVPTADDGSAGPGGPTTTSPGGSGSTGGDEMSDATGDCPLGTLDCPCDARVCVDGSICSRGVCVPDTCGDRMREGWEECDDGNGILGDGCDDCLLSGGARSIVAGNVHTCALLWDGAVRCWGAGAQGRLGYGSTADVGDDEHPYQVGNVPLGGAAKAITAGGDFNCALMGEGRVRCWGEGGAGRLGNESTEDMGDGEDASASPLVSLGAAAVQISSGDAHSCAVLQNADLVCWGDGGQGRLGYGNQDNIGDDEPPGSVGPVNVGADVVEVAAGGAHTCVRLVTGGVKCWGNGGAGRLGYGNNTTTGDSPGEIPANLGEVPIGVPVERIAAGGAHTCVILGGGAMRCWGSNNSGQCGYGGGGNLGDMANETPDMLGDIDLPSAVVDMDLGTSHTCAILDDGTVRCWGEADDGRLGYGGTTDLLAPDPAPVQISATQEILALAGGGAFTCARLDLGNVRCWGLGDVGQLGYANDVSVAEVAGETPESAGDVLILPP